MYIRSGCSNFQNACGQRCGGASDCATRNDISTQSPESIELIIPNKSKKRRPNLLIIVGQVSRSKGTLLLTKGGVTLLHWWSSSFERGSTISTPGCADFWNARGYTTVVGVTAYITLHYILVVPVQWWHLRSRSALPGGAFLHLFPVHQTHHNMQERQVLCMLLAGI